MVLSLAEVAVPIPGEDEVLVRHYSRSDGWKERKLRKAEDALPLPAIDADLTLADIYRDTGLPVA